MAQSDERKPLVAFLGPKASYTHQATLSLFPESSYTLHPSTSIEEVFHSVQNNLTPHGIVPFENSSNGPVGFTLDLFADTTSQYPDILVEEEIYLPVRHCLVGHKSSSFNPEDFSHIAKLYSHPQAWTQCNSFLATHFKGVERQDVSSTSRAAEIAASDPTGKSASISSSIAATLNNVPVLAEGIEDIKGNTTRFFVLRHRSSPSTFPANPPSSPSESKTLISFRLKRERDAQSGALAESLGVFARHGLNLTSILSRPSREAAWHYVFFVEVQGSGRMVDEALEELGKVVEGWRWLGSWRNKLVREL